MEEEKPIDDMTVEESLAQTAVHEEDLGLPTSTRIALGFLALLAVSFTNGVVRGTTTVYGAVTLFAFFAVIVSLRFLHRRHRVRITARGIDIYRGKEWLEHVAFSRIQSAEVCYALPTSSGLLIAYVHGRTLPLRVIMYVSSHGYAQGALIRLKERGETMDRFERWQFIPTRDPAGLLVTIQRSAPAVASGAHSRE